MTSRITRGVLVAMSVALTTPASADEGQWTPDQIPELGLPQKGLAVPLESLYRPDDQGLLAAIVNYDGCSASFVSPDGLVITNHHCAYDDLHDNATPEHDYVKDGFLARRRDEELRTPGRLLVLEEVRDVSGEMRAVVEAEADDRARHRALEQKDKALVAACEAEPGHRCQVASFYAGSVYRLFRYLELRDVRIVYAPPAAIGEYGGEID
ncbi:MAG: S46 family peptidase, partial [Myxococcales bacterium]|nr:S46 family peptidase [Myxococcales bacterium]